MKGEIEMAEYYLQKHKQDAEKVPKWKYIEALKLAGYWMGDYQMVHSFYDPQHDMRGWVK